MGAPTGNQNAHKGRIWTDAIRMALCRKNRKRLKKLAETLVQKAEEGDMTALREVGDRLEGKPAQAITGPDGGVLEIRTIERVIIRE